MPIRRACRLGTGCILTHTEELSVFVTGMLRPCVCVKRGVTHVEDRLSYPVPNLVSTILYYTIGAYIITKTVLGVPYNYSRRAPKPYSTC